MHWKLIINLKIVLLMTKKVRCCVLLGLSLVLFSCNQEQNFEPQTTEKRMYSPQTAVPEEGLTWEERYEMIDVQEYLDTYPELFGEVLVFNDFETIDNLLDELATKNFEELREWYGETNYHSDIIESNIVFDSVLSEIAEIYGIRMDGEYKMTEEEVSALYSDFIEVMSEEHPEMCSFSEEYGRVCVNPFGSVDDESALANEKGLIIIDKVVHKYQQGYLINCPIDKYVLLPEFAEVEELFAACAAGLFPNVSEDDISWAQLPKQETEEDNMKSHVAKRGGYKMSVYLTAYPVWWAFSTNIRGKFIVKNSYYGSALSAHVTGTTVFHAKVNYKKQDTEYYTFFGNFTAWGTYKQRTYRYTWIRDKYTPTKRTIVSLYESELNMDQTNNFMNIKISCKHQ